VADWLSRYPSSKLTYESVFQVNGLYWRERVWDTKAGQIAEGHVDDASGIVTEAWTGPQVAWGMAPSGASRSTRCRCGSDSARSS
jgi:hypothetical protein